MSELAKLIIVVKGIGVYFPLLYYVTGNLEGYSIELLARRAHCIVHEQAKIYLLLLLCDL